MRHRAGTNESLNPSLFLDTSGPVDIPHTLGYSEAVFPAQAALALALLQAASPAHSDSSAIRQDVQQDIQTGHYEDARKEVQQAIKRTPQDASLWSLLGEVNARLQDTDAAIAALQKASSLAPKSPDVYFDLGLLFMQKGATGEALKVYRQGLALDPQNEPANQNYALLLMQQGKPCEAVGPLQRLKGTKSSDLAVRASLIESLWKCGNSAAGKKELAAFLQMRSATTEDRMALAKALGRDHLSEAAEEVLENVTETTPDFAEAHADLGLLLLQKNQFQDSARQVGRAVQLEPSSARYSMDLAQVLLKARQYPTALEFLKGAKDRFGTLPEYQYKLAWANYGLGNVSEAEAELKALAEEHPELDRVHYSMGNCYVALGRLPEAEASYRQAIALNPKNASYHAALGQVLRKKGEEGLSEAVKELETALELDSSNPSTRVELAICYEQQASLPTAERLLKATVREQPDMADAHRVLARVYYREGMKEQGDRESAIVSRLDANRDARQRPPGEKSPAPESF